jgi:hypothetical protein
MTKTAKKQELVENYAFTRRVNRGNKTLEQINLTVTLAFGE